MRARTDQSEQVVFTRVAADLPFDMLRARYVRQEFVPHAHDEYAVGVVEAGIGRIRHANGAEENPAGSLIVIPAGMVHTGVAAAAEGWSYRMLYLPPAYLERAAERAGLGANTAPWFDKTSFTDPELAARLVTIHTELEHPELCLAALQRLDDLLVEVVRRHAKPRALPGKPDGASTIAVRAVRAFLDEAFAKPVTVDDMARVAHLSPHHLIRAFRRTFGLPPYMYVEQLRVQRARQLIERGTPIATAAVAAGFSDQSHLTRRFKRTLGITPGVFARRVRGKAIRV